MIAKQLNVFLVSSSLSMRSINALQRIHHLKMIVAMMVVVTLVVEAVVEVEAQVVALAIPAGVNHQAQ
jgi:hypothetical protein